MNNHLSIFLKFGVGAMALATLSGCLAADDMGDYAPTVYPPPPVPFNLIHFEGTGGQVGYHMNAYPTNPHMSSPTGTGCTWTHSNNTEVRGTLPPGIEFDGWSKFNGTPRQAGTWRVAVLFRNLRCSDGADQSDYGSRRVSVRFNIEP